jgi:CRISPR/Cas system-associated exonuclease Cas4 (RecB family)
MHLGLEKGTDAMEDYYYQQYPLITDAHINEIIKLKTLVEKGQMMMEEFVEGREVTFEYEIKLPAFKGFVDLILHNQDLTIDVYDFKYSNNVENYLKSKQLHLYKHFLEGLGFKVSKLGYIFIPKTQIRQKKTEDLYQFRKRLKETLSTMEVKIIEVEYDHQKVKNFFNSCREIETVKNYEKAPSKLCAWCEFQKYCEEELDYMLLPKNEKRVRKMDLNPDKWVYGTSSKGLP